MKFQFQNQNREGWSRFEEQQNQATLFPYGLTDPVGANYPSSKPLAARGNIGGGTQRKLRFADYLYEFSGSEVALDIIRLPFGGPTGKWPKGTEVFPQLCYAYVETDCATTLTLDVGDLDTAAASAAYPDGTAYAVAHIASDADRYCDGIDCGAVGVDAFASGVAAAIPHVLQEACYLTATLATLVTPAAAGVLRIRIAYFEV